MKHTVLFVGGDEDGLRVEVDMSNQEEALKVINQRRTSDSGYELHRMSFDGNDDDSVRYMYLPEYMSMGDAFRKLHEGYKNA